MSYHESHISLEEFVYQPVLLEGIAVKLVYDLDALFAVECRHIHRREFACGIGIGTCDHGDSSIDPTRYVSFCTMLMDVIVYEDIEEQPTIKNAFSHSAVPRWLRHSLALISIRRNLNGQRYPIR